VVTADPAATQAVGQFGGETFLQEDVASLHTAYGLPSHVVGVSGPEMSLKQAGEGSLDLQTITSLAPGAPTTWWGVSPHTMDGFMMAYSVQVNDHPSPPLVHSISWGDAEALYPPAFVERLDYELMKLTLRGITVIVASGDNGNSAIGTKCAFTSDLLASSPWVTTVGATMPSLEASPYCQADSFQKVIGICEELGQATCSAASGALITSSGYFSIYRERPSYQESVLRAYVNSSGCKPCKSSVKRSVLPPDANEERLTSPCQHISPDSGCAVDDLLRTKRAAPDVALPGQSYLVLVNGSVISMDGTSASAPALAAMVSLLNSEQIRRGRPPLGLLNPWLYQSYARQPGAFLDVKVGSTGSSEDNQCSWGWEAAPGWDPATGLGVPRFEALRALLPKGMILEPDVGATVAHLEEEVGPAAWAANPVAVAATAAVSFATVLLLGLDMVLRRADRRTLASQEPLLG